MKQEMAKQDKGRVYSKDNPQLPLIIVNESKYDKLKIIYDKDNGIAIPDGKVELWVSMETGEHVISSENVILAARIYQARYFGTDKYKYIEIWYAGQKINIDKNGELNKYPSGFCDTHTKLLIELLDFIKPIDGQMVG